MDLEAEKAKRDARIKAKEEIIRNELSSTDDTPVPEDINAEEENDNKEVEEKKKEK